MRRATRRLRVVLYLAAAVCGVCVLGVFAPRPMIENWMVLRYGPMAQPNRTVAVEVPASRLLDEWDLEIKDLNAEELPPVEVTLSVPQSPVFGYCVRIACAVCTFAAMYFVLLARRPMRYTQFVQLGAAGFMCTSGVALMAGVYLHLRPLGYVIDAFTMLALGVLLFVYSQPPKKRRRARGE